MLIFSVFLTSVVVVPIKSWELQVVYTAHFSVVELFSDPSLAVKCYFEYVFSHQFHCMFKAFCRSRLLNYKENQNFISTLEINITTICN